MYTKILIATDGSRAAHKAVEIGAELAARSDAEVCLVHVLLSREIDSNLKRMVEVEQLAPPESRPIESEQSSLGFQIAFPTSESSSSYRAMHAIGTEILKRAALSVKERGVSRVTENLLDGNPADEIIRMVDREHPDLVVCGARGLSTLSKLVLGSVSAKIAHACKVPCLTLHPAVG